MNREIKFRGKCTDNGEWVAGSLLQDDYGNCMIVGFIDHHEIWYSVSPETVGQFTGLRDRNGEDIYEGDILHIGSSKKGKPVAYSNEYAAFGIQYPDRDFFPFAHDLQDISETCYEVIGNIHDNPELKKGGAQ